MTAEPIPVDVSAIPELARLADEVNRSRTPRVLRRDGTDLALIVPAGSRTRRRAKFTLIDTSDLPPVPHRTVDEVAGFAGRLPRPLSWDEIRAVVDAERAEAWRAKYS